MKFFINNLSLLNLIFFSITCLQISAQEDGDAIDGGSTLSNSRFENLDLKSGQDDIKLNVSIYYINNSSGNGYHQSSTNDNLIMDALNDSYAHHGISFNLLSSSNKENNTLYNATTISPYYSYCCNYQSNRYDKRSIAIFVATNFIYAGQAYLGSPGMVVKGTYMSSTDYFKKVVQHEMGHVLGLYHTFWGTKYNFGTCSTMRGELSGTSPCTKKGSNQSPEYVNGTNASSSGDFIPDTSADPNTWTTSGNYNEICYCVNDNSSYSPLANNIMSYNSSSSRTNNPHDMTTNQATSMNLASREDRYLSMTHAVDIIGASSIFNNDIIDYNYSTTMDPNNIYSVTYNMTNNSNAVSINSSTGVVNVMGVTEGIETLTCTIRHKYNAPWNDLI